MNDTHSSDHPGGQPSGHPAGQPGGRPAGNGFFAWIRGLGIVRGNERWFAGVAGGVAAKAGIDPLIVRGIFVVLAVLGGPGILLYLLGWLLLPDFTGRIHVEEIFRGRASAGVVTAAIVIAALVVIPAFFSIFSPVSAPFSVWGWGVWNAMGIPEWLRGTVAWLFWIAIIVGGILWLRAVMLKRGRAASAERGTSAGAAAHTGGQAAHTGGQTTPTDGQTAPPAGASGSPADFTAQARAFADRTEEYAQRASEQASDWGKRASEQANDWGKRATERATRWSDEVGKQADEWSARYAEHHDAHRMGTAQSVITLALALLAGGGAAAWALLNLSVSPTTAFIGGLTVAVAVLAVSLIVAGIRGRQTGWVGFLASCGVVALLVTVVLPWGSRFQPFGTMHVAGTSAPGTVLLAGTSEVDLTVLDDSTPTGEDLEVWQLAGNVEIELPDYAPAVVQVRVLAGAILEEGDEPRGAGGPLLARTITANMPALGTAGYEHAAAEASHVTVYLLAGRVEVSGVTENARDRFGEKERARLEAEEQARLNAEQQKQSSVEEQTRIAAELERVEWKLSEPGLSARDTAQLETARDELQTQLDELKTEATR